MSTGSGSPCGACKFLRRKCVKGCIFAPYFSYERGASHFSSIHKVFGASNVSKLLAHLPISERSEAALTISYEAQARVHDPIYGCVSHVFALQQQVVNLQAVVETLRAKAAQTLGQGCSTPSNSHVKLPSFPHSQDVHSSWFPSDELQNMMPQYEPILIGQQRYNIAEPTLCGGGNGSMDSSSMANNNNHNYQCFTSILQEQEYDGSYLTLEGSSSNYTIATHDFGHDEGNKWPSQDADDLHSVAFGYFGR
ncbi:hypothetical protein Dimus_032407 [Dionaea muscipula]